MSVPDGRRVYVNFIPADSGERLQEVYGDSKYSRLSEIKYRYDPRACVGAVATASRAIDGVVSTF